MYVNADIHAQINKQTRTKHAYPSVEHVLLFRTHPFVEHILTREVRPPLEMGGSHTNVTLVSLLVTVNCTGLVGAAMRTKLAIFMHIL